MAWRRSKINGSLPAPDAGARHAGEIECVLQTFKSQEGVPWTPDEFKVSEPAAER
jgi:hypothetical protein